jgi:hypothetical protein
MSYYRSTGDVSAGGRLILSSPVIKLCLLLVLAACTGLGHAASQANNSHEEPPLYLCVMADRGIRVLEAQVDAATGDTLVQGRNYTDLYENGSPPYTEHGETFRVGRTVVLGGHRYAASQPEQSLLPAQTGVLEWYMELDGVPVFTERGAGPSPAVIYVPVRPGCVFQSFQRAQGYPVR